MLTDSWEISDTIYVLKHQIKHIYKHGKDTYRFILLLLNAIKDGRSPFTYIVINITMHLTSNNTTPIDVTLAYSLQQDRLILRCSMKQKVQPLTIVWVIHVDDFLPAVVEYGVYDGSVVVWSHAESVVNKARRWRDDLLGITFELHFKWSRRDEYVWTESIVGYNYIDV